jgi:hypothetical protein
MSNVYDGGYVMARIGLLIMAIGFLTQVLVPLGVFGRPEGLMFGVPTQLALVFLGTWILVAGLVIVYFTWLMPYARALDRSFNVQD